MDDTISRQAAIDEINKLEYPSSLVDVKRIIVDLPSAERKKGKWINSFGLVQCSECRIEYFYKYKYCPNCGAEMKEENDDEC